MLLRSVAQLWIHNIHSRRALPWRVHRNIVRLHRARRDHSRLACVVDPPIGHDYGHSRRPDDPCSSSSLTQQGVSSCRDELGYVCDSIANGDEVECSADVGSSITRDDLMNTGFGLQGVTFPLNLTIWNITAVPNALGAEHMGSWQVPVLLSISEVNASEEGEFPGWIIMVICLGVGGVVCCFVVAWICPSRTIQFK